MTTTDEIIAQIKLAVEALAPIEGTDLARCVLAHAIDGLKEVAEKL